MLRMKHAQFVSVVVSKKSTINQPSIIPFTKLRIYPNGYEFLR